MLGVARQAYDEDEFGEDFTATVLSPGIAIAVVRPTDTSIVGLEIGAGYGRGTFSGDALDALGWGMKSNVYTAGADLYLRLISSPTLQVYPSISAYYASASSEIEDSFNNSIEENVDDVLFSAAVSLFINNKVHITPSFSSFDGSSSWGIGLGLVTPTQ